jgi:hypothetical protein
VGPHGLCPGRQRRGDRKRALARFYAARVLPQAQGLASTIASSADVLYLLADEAF